MNETQVDLELIYEKVRSMVGEVKEWGRQGREAAVRSPVSADEAERRIFRNVLELGRLLMGQFFAEAGDGDLGQQTTCGQLAYWRKQRFDKQYQSVFGQVSFRQWKYVSEGAPMWPLEQKLNLPERQASYFVQEILAQWASDVPFEQAAGGFGELFDQMFSSRTVGELAAEATRHDQSFTEHRATLTEPAPPPAVATVQAVSFDGAGVPMRPESRLADQGVKREAMIGVVYEAALQPRVPRALATALIDGRCGRRGRDPDEPPTGEAPVRVELAPYYRASLQDKEQVVIDLAVNARQRRRPGQPQVVLLDGAHRLWDLGHLHFDRADAYILDIVHVAGYLELAASVLAAEQNRYVWLVAQLTQILQGQTPFLVTLYEQELTNATLSQTAAENLRKVITYFRNHLPYMHYHEYLRAGYPVATGVVESACKQLLRRRLDIAGARWNPEHAEAILKLRAMQRSTDAKSYRHWQQNQEYERLYVTAA